ncbi:related to EAF7 Esa1 associated protein, subunit of the NuA4 histone acetyltransferase complex [Rhynchosporium secalis]|uniref:Related to EAF7 Esa1 associated protein, subunit of the NuA4 histone acetyltransferase complex n=1 Tax=Rhynchosporium secalis TaxID=38038 RepID=A0A1E1M3M3_RHYSE|nr:related to EAF7 Esa1 associated protein, subunit of the NuA4 histone acetyltransferase complex [Rhynchosporium secalis]
MPPRKKAKGSVRAPSTPAADEDSMVVDTPQPDTTEASKPAYDILKDPWTDEQETSLFKGIIRWKPAGIHKHFRMIAISEHLRNHGNDPTIEQHTRIPGIWIKLRTMYDLDIIDDRENYFDEEQFIDFKLPEDEFDELMFKKGRRRTEADEASEAPSSPPQLGRASSPPRARKRKRGDVVAAKSRADTVEETDEARTSPANSPPKLTRTGRSTNRSIGRLKGGSTSRQQSKDTSMTADTADEDDVGEETEEVAEEDEDVEEEEGTASPKPLKTSKVKADPPIRKSRRKK